MPACCTLCLLRDFLLWLALPGLYCPRWTDAIHEEWMRSLLRDRTDLTRDRLERTRDLRTRRFLTVWLRATTA